MKQMNNDELLLKENIEARYEKLTLKDDFMFGKIMQNEQNCIDMLERLTGNKIESVKSSINQKSIRITNDSKGVRYDVYVEDGNTNIYDTEMQQNKQDTEELSKRIRFYQGMVDLNLLESGGEYSELKNSYIIFICTFDPFGKGLYCYEFKNICKDDAELSLLDGRKILIYNTKGKNINVSKKTMDFLDYIETNKVCDEYTERLNKDVAIARMNKEWRVEYMKTLLHDSDVKREGREEQKRIIVINMLRKGIDISEICELAECSAKYVEEVRRTME